MGSLIDAQAAHALTLPVLYRIQELPTQDSRGYLPESWVFKFNRPSYV